VIYRADSSGTSNIFTSALASFSPKWTFGTTSVWPAALRNRTNQIGGVANEGVYSLVQSTDNSIAYTSYSFIINNAFLRVRWLVFGGWH